MCVAEAIVVAGAIADAASDSDYSSYCSSCPSERGAAPQLADLKLKFDAVGSATVTYNEFILID